ncbi:MAG: hypothetical protein KGJ13_00645 [Patescibacteria group bacterium]|nr:hypothetical protein [Patescibacteria group bacterium]
MSNPSFDQAYQLLSVTREAGISLEGLQALYKTGLLSDLLKAETPAKVDREAFRKILGYDRSSFLVKMNGTEDTDAIIAALKAEGGWNYFNEWINQENFPLEVGGSDETDEIVIHDPGTSFTEEGGLAILKGEGLLRPTYKHALRFVRQHGKATTSTKKPFVIFLHKPWRDPRRFPRVLCVVRRPGDRELYLLCSEGRFYDYCVLAGVRPRKQPSVA